MAVALSSLVSIDSVQPSPLHHRNPEPELKPKTELITFSINQCTATTRWRDGGEQPPSSLMISKLPYQPPVEDLVTIVNQ